MAIDPRWIHPGAPVRIVTRERPRREDLLFGGLSSPHHPSAAIVSRLAPHELALVRAEGLRVGALRSSGARPEHADPTSVAEPIARAD